MLGGSLRCVRVNVIFIGISEYEWPVNFPAIHGLKVSPVAQREDVNLFVQFQPIVLAIQVDALITQLVIRALA